MNITKVNAQALTGSGVIPAGAKEIGFFCLSGILTLAYEGNTIVLDATGMTASPVINFEEEEGAVYGEFAYDVGAGLFQYGDRR